MDMIINWTPCIIRTVFNTWVHKDLLSFPSHIKNNVITIYLDFFIAHVKHQRPNIDKISHVLRPIGCLNNSLLAIYTMALSMLKH